MLRAYLNYPNSRVSVHADPACVRVRQAHKSGQRLIRLRPATLSAELLRFAGDEYQFASQSTTNDMWLDLDFSDPAFELAVAHHIHVLLGARYKRFRDCSVEQHCL